MNDVDRSNKLKTSSLKAPRTGGVRFAPSPTGLFHLGNLRTAWISWQWAQKLHLPWIVRFEDIDTPRVQPGAREKQLQDLIALKMTPGDFGAPDLSLGLLQTDFRLRHWQLFVEAIQTGQVYACDCSRKEVQTALAGLASAPHDGRAPIYSGVCRSRAHGSSIQAADSLAWRFKMADESGHDDFIIARTSVDLNTNGLPSLDGFVPAYHWACAIDDFDGDYDLLVRCHDLASAAHLQRVVHAWVGKVEGERAPAAIYHTALVCSDDGHRLEKRTRGVTLDELRDVNLLALLNKNAAPDFDFIPQRGSISSENRTQITISELLANR